MSVFVISESVVSPLGIGASLNYESILEGKSGIALHQSSPIAPYPFYASIIEDKVLFEFWESKLQAKIEKNTWENLTKLEKMLFVGIYDAFQGNESIIGDINTALILTTTKGNIKLANRGFSEDILLWKTADKIAKLFKHPNVPYTVSNACISGLSGMILGRRLIEQKLAKTAIVIGGDIVSEFIFSGFASFKAISTEPCRPYDKDRLGITLGEGVGVVVLSETESEIKLSGGCISNDANHISGPSRTGDGLAIAINSALNEAEISKNEIGFISLHGTGTTFNDEMEAQALNGLGLNMVPAHSLKGYFGHTLGAAGLMEAAINIQMLRKGKSIPSQGFSEIGTTLPLNISTSPVDFSPKVILKTASGFGGCNAAVIFDRKETFTKNHTKGITASASYSILSSVHISSSQINVNGEEVYNEKFSDDVDEWLNSFFRKLCSGYLKFFKMDRLSKLGFLASELLLKNIHPLEKYAPENIGILIANYSSSLDTDFQHQDSINDKDNYFPSPAVFVYTLPNILMGEIAIRNNFKGENLCLIMPDQDWKRIHQQIDILFSQTTTQAIVFGWVEVLRKEFECKLFWAEKS